MTPLPVPVPRVPPSPYQGHAPLPCRRNFSLVLGTIPTVVQEMEGALGSAPVSALTFGVCIPQYHFPCLRACVAMMASTSGPPTVCQVLGRVFCVRQSHLQGGCELALFLR